MKRVTKREMDSKTGQGRTVAQPPPPPHPVVKTEDLNLGAVVSLLSWGTWFSRRTLWGKGRSGCGGYGKLPSTSRQGYDDRGLGESEGQKQTVGHLPHCLWPLVHHRSRSHPVRTENVRPGQIRTGCELPRNTYKASTSNRQYSPSRDMRSG